MLDNTVLKPCHVGVFYLLRLDGERLGVCVNGGLEKEDLGMEFYRGVALVPHMDTFAVWGIEDDAFLSQERDDGRRNVVS